MDSYDYEAEKHFEDTGSLKSVNLRLGFIRKVYLILTAQLLATVGLSVIGMTTSFGTFQTSTIALLWFFAILAIVLMLVICCVPSIARQVPTNYILLGLFTFSEAYVISYVCAAYEQNGYGSLVIWAALLTLGMTIALTVYAFTTKTDITIYGGFLFCVSIGLFFFSILAFFTQLKFLQILITVIAIILYGTYLVYDTQLIAGGKRFQLTLDDYIIGAIQLYLDIVILFLEILRLLSLSKK